MSFLLAQDSFIPAGGDLFGGATAQAVTCQPVTLQVGLRCRTSPCGSCAGQSGTGAASSMTTIVLLCQCHSTNTPYSFIYHQLPIILAIDSVKILLLYLCSF